MRIFKKEFWIRLLNLKTIDVYITKQLLISIGLILFVLVGVAWLSQIIKLIELFFSHNLSTFFFLRFTSFIIPSMVAIVLPICIFISAIFVYNRLINDRELVVMKSAGMDNFRLFKPLKILSIGCFIFLLFLNCVLNPLMVRQFKHFRNNIINDISSMVIKEKQFNQLTNGLTIYIDSSKGNNLYDIFIYDGRNANDNKTIYAEKGQIIKTPSGFSVMLVKGSLHQTHKTDSYDFGTFEVYNVDLGLHKQKNFMFTRPKEMYMSDLINTKNLPFVNDQNRGNYTMEIHKRILSSFFVIFFPLIAIFFILKGGFSRHGNSNPTIKAIIAVTLYYATFLSLLNYFRNFPSYAWVLYILVFLSIYLPMKALKE